MSDATKPLAGELNPAIPLDGGTTEHSYPGDLAAFVVQHWQDAIAFGTPYHWMEASTPGTLPDPVVLERLLSTIYQASLLREEDRPVRFRLMLRQPGEFPADNGLPGGLHRVVFTEPRPFNEHELRRLSPATDFHRSLIGVGFGASNDTLEIWGQIHTGMNWIQAIDGGRRTFEPLPATLVVSVLGPGRITVSHGSLTIGKLSSGNITSPTMGIGDAAWAQDAFAETQTELYRLHMKARRNATVPWATVEPGFARLIGQRVGRQIISAIRNARHGGALIMLPPRMAATISTPNPFISLKYSFAGDEARWRLRNVVVQLMNALAAICGKTGDPARTVGWFEYVSSTEPEMDQYEEALVEAAHTVASLTAVDGVVVMAMNHELLGFAGEISGALDSVSTVAHALDANAESTRLENTQGVGTRHRSAYRLCNALHDAVAIVVSQDGGVSSIKWKDGHVTCWDQMATSVLDI